MGQDTAYTDERQNKYFNIEDLGWWYKYRIRIFIDLIKSYFDKNAQILDIGGSNGFNSKKIQDEGFDVKLLEPSEQGCLNAKKRGVINVVCIPFEDYEADILQAMLLDVLEHIKDDVGFLNTLYKRIGGGGSY